MQHNICNLRYKTPKEIPVVFHNGSKCDSNRELAEECKEKSEYLGENTEKCINFLRQINKELEIGKAITCKIKFTDSVRFMSSSLSSLVDNLSDCLHNTKFIDCKFCLASISSKDELSIFNCLKCSKNHEKHFNKYLIKGFANTYYYLQTYSKVFITSVLKYRCLIQLTFYQHQD